MSHSPWVDVLLEHLSAEPTTTDELVDLLSAEYPDVEAEEVDKALEQVPSAYLMDNDLWVDLAALTDGIVLTHIVGADEIATDQLRTDVDLEILAELGWGGLRLPGGGTVETEYDDDKDDFVLKGPERWLSGYEDGTLISLRLHQGVLEVAAGPDEPTGDPDADDLPNLLQTEASDALDRYITARHRSKVAVPWVPLLPTLVELLTRHRQLLRRPTAPIAACLLMAGVEYWDGMIGMAGAPQSAEDAQDLSDEQVRGCVRASVILIGAGLAPEEFEEDIPLLFATLDDPAVTELIAARVAEPLEDATLDLLARVARWPSERALVALLRGRSAEADGDSLAAERHIADALRDNPQLRPALEDAGIYAADRGDLSTADDYLKRADFPSDHGLRGVIRRLRSTPATKVGRNQPCPCGSGRKYKVCHLREEVHPLPDRVALVYARLLTWAARWVVDEAPPGVKSPDPMLMLDLAIFEGGLAEEYLQRRGPLLREDERALIERWLSSRPQPYEVSDAKAGTWITLRPLLDGDPVTLHDRLLSQTARPGDVMVARIVDSGEGPTVATNPHAVPPLRRPDLIALFDEFTPEALLAFFDQAPPVLQNRDGHDLVLCEVTFEVPAAGATAAWRRLAASLTDKDGPDTLLWGRDLDEETLHLGTVTRKSRLWTLRTNSRERMEELESFVFEAAPNARLVSSTATPAREAAESAPPPSQEPMTPELQEAVRQHIERYESKWVDDEIPALDGLTPRQALAAGAVARKKLEALLDGMEQLESENSMSAKRVRTLLGLTTP